MLACKFAFELHTAFRIVKVIAIVQQEVQTVISFQCIEEFLHLLLRTGAHARFPLIVSVRMSYRFMTHAVHLVFTV